MDTLLHQSGVLLDAVLSNPVTPYNAVWSFICVVLLSALAVAVRGKPKGVVMATPGEKKMNPKEREALEDAFVLAFEEAVFKGSMGRKSARYWYKKMALEFNLPGLLTKKTSFQKSKLHPAKASRLKAEIKSRLENPPWEITPIKRRSTTKDKFKRAMATTKAA